MPKLHKHHQQIRAWADGAKIQFLNDNVDGLVNEWINCDGNPGWYETLQYRVKLDEPDEPKYRIYKQEDQGNGVINTVGFITDEYAQRQGVTPENGWYPCAQCKTFKEI